MTGQARVLPLLGLPGEPLLEGAHAPTTSQIAAVMVSRSVVGGDERRHRVDEVAERPQPHAAVEGELGHLLHVHRRGRARPRRRRRGCGRRPRRATSSAGARPRRSRSSMRADVGGVVVRRQQVEAGVGDGAGERVPHEGRAVHHRAGGGVAHPLRHLGRAEGGGEGEVAAGQRLAHADDVGALLEAVLRERAAGAPEAGGDLVVDHQRAVLAGEPAEVVDAAGRPGAHAAGALEQRLDDHGRDLVGVLLEQVRDLGGPARRSPRRRVGGSGAKTCSGTMPAYMLCIPPSGSHTLIGEKVSPW